MTTTRGYNKPLPTPNAMTQPYWEHAKRHQLSLQQCDDCSHVWFPPSYCCPKCLSERYSWKPVSGRAKLWSWIDMWQLYFRGFADERPYLVAYVELEEGPRLMTSLVDFNRDELRCDLPLRVVFDDVTSEVTLPKFTPVR